MLLNCSAREASWESFGQQGDPVNPKGNLSWIFIGRTDVESSNTLATWWELTHWKRPWCWERLRQEQKGAIKDEMVGWHLWLNGHELVLVLVVGDGQGSLANCSPWGCKDLDMTVRLNWLIGLHNYIFSFWKWSSLDIWLMLPLLLFSY